MARQRFISREQIPEGWLSRARLARAAGVSRATVKHYYDLGLLPPAAFTSPNMAYYAPESAQRIRLVRELQEKRHLPLSVIAEMIAAQGPERVAQAFEATRALEADLLDTLSGSEREPATKEELLAVEGIDERVLAELEELGLLRKLSGKPGKKDRYDAVSRKVVRAVGVMRREGLTEEAGFEVKDLALYRDRLAELVEEEIALFTTRVLARLSAQKAEPLMRAGLQGASALVLAVRDRLLADALAGALKTRKGK